MKKLFKIILISLGAVAAVAGFASLSYGTSSFFQKYLDEKNNDISEPVYDSKSSSSKDSSKSSSSSGGASSSSESPISSSSDPGSSSSQTPVEPEEIALILSKDKIFLDDEEQGAAEDTITATVTGCDSTVSWLVTSSNYIAVSESTTNSGEENTVSTNAIFDNVENIRVSLTDDPTIYKDIKVYYLNEPDFCCFNSIGVWTGSYDDTATNTKYNNPHTYNENGVYFDTNTYIQNNRDGNFLDTPEEAMEAGKSLNVTYSPGARCTIEIKLRPHYRSYQVQWPAPYEDFDFFDYWNWWDEDYSTMEYDTITCDSPQNISLYWVYKIKIDIPDDFVSKTGDLVINFGGKYFCVHFNAYLPGVTGVQ